MKVCYNLICEFNGVLTNFPQTPIYIIEISQPLKKTPGVLYVVNKSISWLCFSALQFRNFKIIYRRYAGLYFCICVDVTDNNLAYLEGIHNFVEVSLKSVLACLQKQSALPLLEL